MSSNVIIIGVPDVAEFHKYWIVSVSEEDPSLKKYITSFFNEDDAIEFLKNSSGYTLITNKV